MKRAFVLAFALLCTAGGWAQDRVEGLSADFSLGQWKDSMVFGAGIQSPLLFGSAAFRAQAFLVLTPRLDGIEETMDAYPAARVGLAGYSGVTDGGCRLYGAGGLLVAMPSAKLSDATWVFGGWGCFGFEFFTGEADASGGFCYYIELGTNSSGAKTDKLPAHEFLLNGFACQAGVRWYP